MNLCLAIPVFVLVSSVVCLDTYSFDTEFQPMIQERNNMYQNEQTSSLGNLANDHYLFDSASKEELDDDLENPSNPEQYTSLWDSGNEKNIPGDSRLLDAQDVIQGLQNIQEDTGFPSFRSKEYFNRKQFRKTNMGPTDLDTQNQEYLKNPAEVRVKSKRSGHSLSIVNPLDVLRQRMLLDMARQRMAKNQAQIQINDNILQKLGKRSHNLSSFAFIRRGQLSSGEKSAQRKRRQRRDYITGKQVPTFEQLEV